MPKALHLEDFTPTELPPMAREQNESMTEAQRLSAFEQGYQAGWDDAMSSASEDNQRITSDLESQLKDLSFGFHEARMHVLTGVSDLVRTVISNLVPRIGAEILPDLVAESLRDLMEEAASQPIILRISSQNRQAIEQALPADPGFPITIEESADFAPGQVAFIMGQSERQLDLDACFERIQEDVAAFFTENERQLANG